jgi:GntR family transcriptional regulator
MICTAGMIPLNPSADTVGLVGMLLDVREGDDVADPMWRQIAESLRQRIESGDLGGDGQPLPTELELQAEYKASRNTVRDAIKWLVARNLVYTRSGQGTFVAPKIDPFVTKLLLAENESESSGFATEVLNSSRQPSVSEPRVEILQAAGLPAAELGLEPDATVISRHQQRSIDGVPYSRQTTFYPMDLVQHGAARLINAANIDGGAVRYIEQQLGMKEAGTRDRIAVRLPDPEETSFFRLPDDGRVAVTEITRTGYDGSGRPLRVTVTTYPADRNAFVIVTGDVPADRQ